MFAQRGIPVLVFVILAALSTSIGALAESGSECDALPNWQDFRDALVKARAEKNGGLNLDMWGTLVSTDGSVCAVTFTGKEYTAQWLGSRVISAQKANTANAFSLSGLALSTANLYSAVQPGGSLFGLQLSNPVDTEVAYRGDASDFGTKKDPMVGGRIGGVNVFGGGVALYNESGKRVGALGVSGDTSCADHNIAWKTRNFLKLDYIPGGVNPAKNDNIMYLAASEKPTGFKHPTCGGSENKIKLPATHRK